MGFPYKAKCYICDDDVPTVRLSNTKEGLVAYLQPHGCNLRTKTIVSRFRLAMRIIVGYKPYITDNKDDIYG